MKCARASACRRFLRWRRTQRILRRRLLQRSRRAEPVIHKTTALVASALVAFALPALAQKSDDRVLVYVDDVVPADKSLSADATALTTALCAAIGKEKRFDV